MIVDREDVWDRSGSVTVEGSYVRDLVRSFHVSGFPPGAPPSLMYYQAVTATGLPTPWQAHPFMSNLKAIRYTFEPDSPYGGHVDITYINAAPRYYRGGSGYEEFETFEDINGNPLEVNDARLSEPQVAKIKVPSSGHVLITRRLEPSILITGGIDPENVASIYSNHVNSQAISGLFGGPGTWWMEDISYHNDGYGDVAWEMQYTLRYRSQGWQPRISVLDSDTGLPLKGLIEGVGKKDVTWFLPIDFNALDLT